MNVIYIESRMLSGRYSYGCLSLPKRGLFGSFTDRMIDPRQAGITFSHLFDTDHFSLHIEPAKPAFRCAAGLPTVTFVGRQAKTSQV